MTQYSANTTLSPQVQAAVNASLGAQTNISNVAQNLSQGLGSKLATPLDWSQQQGFLNDITAQNLDRSWDRQGQQFETDLVNRGIRPGSTAYSTAQSDFRNDRSNAYNTANAANYNTALQSQLALRNQPLNELSALLSAGQVAMPTFGATPQTDVAGITNSAYQNSMAQYNSQQKGLGGLFDAGLGLLKLSDRRAKTDVVRIGSTDAGTPIYRFKYNHGGPVQVGYMAQDLLKTHPNAVSMGPDGFYRVDYEKVT